MKKERKDIRLTNDEIKIINIALNQRERELDSQIKNWNDLLEVAEPTKADKEHATDLMHRYFEIRHLNDFLRSIRD